MNKAAIFLLSLFALSMHSMAQKRTNGYTVKVTVNNPSDYKWVLAYQTTDNYVIDTNYTIKNGQIVFRGNVKEPVVASIGPRGDNALVIRLVQGYSIPGPWLQFFLSNEEIQIKGQANTIYMAKVTGGKANKEWAIIKTSEGKLTHESWMALKDAYANFKPGDDSIVFKNADKLRSDNLNKDQTLQEEFIKKNPNSMVSMYFLSGLVNTLSLKKLKMDYAKLGSIHKNSSYAKSIVDKIKSMDATAIGEKAAPINKADLKGSLVTLQSLKGKYTLLVFWGSWCGECRSEDPHLRELYAKYKEDGFEILGIAQEESQSLSQNLKTWKRAVEEDKLPWLQVLNNEGINKYDAVKAYGVTAFPTKILLNKEGKIIARYVGGENDKLDAKLKEIF